MKNISEINPSHFGCFYYTPNKGDTAVYLFTPDGNTEYTEYEAFECENGTVIAFNRFNDTPMDYAYLLNCGESQEIIQYQTYESIEEILQGTKDIDSSVFLFMASTPVSDPARSDNRIIPLGDRCDKHSYGARPFTVVNEENVSSNVFGIGNMKTLTPILTIQGVATLFRITLNTEDGSFRNFGGVVRISKTLTGIFRLACEWRHSTKEPFNNNELQAQKIAEFIDTIGINEQIENDIYSIQGPMAVERYISSPATSRDVVDETVVVPESLIQLIKPKMRYVTLASLSEHTSFVASNDLLNKEKTDVQKDVYSFFAHHGVDAGSFFSIDDARRKVVSLRVDTRSEPNAGINNHLLKLEHLWNR